VIENEDNNVENYVNLWTKIEYVIWGTLSPLCGMVGLTMVLILVNFFDLYLLVFLSIIYTTIIFLRNRLIIKIFHRISHLNFLRLTNLVRYIGMAIIFAVFGFGLDVQFGLNILPLETMTWIIPIFILSVPLETMFSETPTEKGKIRIEFEQVFINLDDFSKRQKWITKAFKRLEYLLREGNIKVSHDKMVYRTNLLMESDDTEGNLRNIERWILSQQRDDSILVYVREILPEDEIKSIERIPLRRYFTLIPEEYIKWIVLGIIVIVIALVNPEILLEFFGKFFS